LKAFELILVKIEPPVQAAENELFSAHLLLFNSFLQLVWVSSHRAHGKKLVKIGENRDHNIDPLVLVDSLFLITEQLKRLAPQKQTRGAAVAQW
jgi:hypothetical protein